jgi:glycosyltransferase involved in cell wall biosynthesis
MRRILHVIDSLDYTGTATQLLVLAKRLALAGFDVHVAALNRHAPRQDEFHAAGVGTNIIPRRFAVDPLADWQLVRHVRRLQPDVVHTWDSTPGMLGALANGKRLVAGRYHLDAWKLPLEWAVERRFLRGGAPLVTNSATVGNWWRGRARLDQQLVVIPIGVEPARASDLSRQQLLSVLNLPENARLIGVVGRLVPEKRVRDLIWAADLLRVLHDNLRVLVIGDGPLRSQLENYARLASDLDHIQFLGAGSDLWRILPHVDVIWNGSDNIGPSSAVLEAMAAGVPLVASDTPANRELVVDGQTGYLIPLGTRAGRAARVPSGIK